MLYNQSRYGRDDDDEKEISDPGEKLDEAIERITRDAKVLADTLGEQVAYLAKRHKLAVEMAKLEDGAKTPIKTLEKRVAVLTQIRAFGPDAWGPEALSNKDLELRMSLLERIKHLEPGEPTPIKKLRERARLLERIEVVETSDDGPGRGPVGALIEDDDELDARELAALETAMGENA